MSEVLIPPSVKPVSPYEPKLIDDQTTVFQPRYGRGLAQRQVWAPPRWSFRVRFEATRDADRALLAAVISAARGKGGTILWSPNLPLRGSFPATELLTNNDFASDTTGWSAGGGAALTAADRVLRMTRASATDPFASQAVSGLTQYAPYVGRVMTGLGHAAENNVGISLDLTTSQSSFGAPGAMRTLAEVESGTTGTFYVDQSVSGVVAGSYWEATWASLARCMVVDGGGNLALHSDTPTNAAWTKSNASASAVAGTAPDGASDAEALIEDGASSTHYMSQTVARSSAVEDLLAFGYFKRRSGTRNVQVLVDDGAGNGGYANFNLATGAVSGSPGLVGTGANARAFIVAAGDDWYFCSVVARCAASTSVRSRFYLLNGTTESYAGDASSSIYAWRCGSARSSFPTRGAVTAAAAASAETQSGSGIYVKGLPASTSGLLKAKDFVEINGELKRLTASLDSDAAGKGYLQFEPELVNPADDNDPVIVNCPMGRFMLVGARETERFGLYTDYEIELEEVYE